LVTNQCLSTLEADSFDAVFPGLDRSRNVGWSMMSLQSEG